MAFHFSPAHRVPDAAARRYDASWTTVGRLTEERAAWRDLSDAAIEPNPLYAANVLIAAEKHLRRGRPLPVLIVRDRAQNGALVGLAPLEALSWINGFPGSAASLFVNPYTTLTHPLIHAEGARAILSELLCFLASEGRGALHFPLVAEKRQFAALLAEVAENRGLALSRVDGWSRPALEPEPENCGASYARAYISKNRRTSNQRRLRRLQELGAVGFEETVLDGVDGRALDAFLALESAGWKGDAATALINKPETHAFARDAFCGADEAPRVRIRSLTLDGRPIAMALDLESQGVGYAFKAAYDPQQARLAPGIALDAHTATRIGPDFEIRRLDSLAQTEIAQEGVWRQQEPIGCYVLDLQPAAKRSEALAWRLRATAAARTRMKRALRPRGDSPTGVVANHKIAAALAAMGVALPILSLLTRYVG